MLKIYNVKDKPEYIEEVAILTQKEWGKHVILKQNLTRKYSEKQKNKEQLR